MRAAAGSAHHQPQNALSNGVTLLQHADFLSAQHGDPLHGKPDGAWAGHRIVMLKGFGDYFGLADDGRPQLIEDEGLGVNIVAVVRRVEGDRVWIKSNGAGDAGVGWVDKKDVIALEDAIPYFTAQININQNDWDAYLGRAEAEHAQTNAKSRLPITPLPLNSPREAARKLKQLPRVLHYKLDQKQGEGQYEEKITVLSGPGRAEPAPPENVMPSSRTHHQHSSYYK
jgi:hypothetical protein